MRSDLIYTFTHDMSNQDWLAFRKQGFGASEIGAVLGLSEYKSALEIFYDKIEPTINFQFENIAMFMGNETESFIAELHQYWDGDMDSIVRNFRTKNVVRKNQRVNAYIQNPEFPHLFVSLDRKINKYERNGVWHPEEVLEIKNMSGFVKQKWEFGIPPVYMAQVQQQLLVTDLKHGELAMLIDGRNYEVHRFERNDEFCEHIINQSADLWNRISKAKSLKTQLYEAELNFNQRLVNEINAEIINLEPDVTGTAGMESFLNDKYKKGTAGSRIGTLEQLSIAKEHIRYKAEVKALEGKIKLIENQLKNSMKDAEILDFSDEGKVYWVNTKSGRRFFRNKVKKQ